MTTPTQLHRTLPHSSEAERTVIGALLLDPDAIYKVADKLRPDDFYDPIFREIYAAIQRLTEEGTAIDFVTVSNALKTSTRIQQTGGSAFLAEIAADIPTASHVEQYAKLVRESRQHRALIELGDKLKGLGFDTDKTADELITTAEQAFLEISQHTSGTDPVPLAELRQERFERYTALFEADDKTTLQGIRSGFAPIDMKLNGFAPGQMIVIAARPSMGKTALALDFAVHAAAEQHQAVTVFSLEMSNQEIFDRLFAKGLQVPAWQLERGSISEESFHRMGQVMDNLGEYPLYVDDTATSVFEIASKARRQKMTTGLDLLIIDYLQLISVEERWARENQTQRMSFISRSIKQLARELQVPVIALSQLSREVERRPGNRPVLSDLRDSGSIEQDADRILMLYREDYYDEDTDRPGVTDVYIRKNRQGPTGQIELKFNAAMMTFQEMSELIPSSAVPTN